MEAELGGRNVHNAHVVPWSDPTVEVATAPVATYSPDLGNGVYSVRLNVATVQDGYQFRTGPQDWYSVSFMDQGNPKVLAQIYFNWSWLESNNPPVWTLVFSSEPA